MPGRSCRRARAGECAGTNGDVHSLSEFHSLSGFEHWAADIPADIHEAVWEKFLLVTAFGGVGAVSRAPIGIIRTVPETRALLQQCMEEVSAVARASRIQLSDSVVSDRMSYVDTLPANSTTSLQRDIAEGKPSELDYWNGSVVRQGRAVKVPTPVNEFIYYSVLPQELRARGAVVFPQ
jgi:2-dehydropantoate 2-reductase